MHMVLGTIRTALERFWCKVASRVAGSYGALKDRIIKYLRANLNNFFFFNTLGENDEIARLNGLKV